MIFFKRVCLLIGLLIVIHPGFCGNDKTTVTLSNANLAEKGYEHSNSIVIIEEPLVLHRPLRLLNSDLQGKFEADAVTNERILQYQYKEFESRDYTLSAGANEAIRTTLSGIASQTPYGFPIICASQAFEAESLLIFSGNITITNLVFPAPVKPSTISPFSIGDRSTDFSISFISTFLTTTASVNKIPNNLEIKTMTEESAEKLSNPGEALCLNETEQEQQNTGRSQTPFTQPDIKEVPLQQTGFAHSSPRNTSTAESIQKLQSMEGDKLIDDLKQPGRMATSFFQSGLFDDCLQILETLEQSQTPLNKELLLIKGKALQAENRLEEALPVFQNLYKNYSKTATEVKVHGLALGRTYQSVGSLSSLQQALKIFNSMISTTIKGIEPSPCYDIDIEQAILRNHQLSYQISENPDFLERESKSLNRLKHLRSRAANDQADIPIDDKDIEQALCRNKRIIYQDQSNHFTIRLEALKEELQSLNCLSRLRSRAANGLAGTSSDDIDIELAFGHNYQITGGLKYLERAKSIANLERAKKIFFQQCGGGDFNQTATARNGYIEVVREMKNHHPQLQKISLAGLSRRSIQDKLVENSRHDMRPIMSRINNLPLPPTIKDFIYTQTN